MLTRALVGVHAGGALIALAMPLPGGVRLGLAVALAVSGYRSLQRQAWRTATDAVRGIELSSDGVCAYRTMGMEAWQPCQAVDRFVHPSLVILRLRAGGRRVVTLVIGHDAVEPETFRQLRAQLRRGAPTAASP